MFLQQSMEKLIGLKKIKIISEKQRLQNRIAIYELELNDLRMKCEEYENIIADLRMKNSIAPPLNMNNMNLPPIPAYPNIPALRHEDDIDMTSKPTYMTKDT